MTGTRAIIFKFDDRLGKHLHHEIAKTEDDWKKTEPFTVFEELQSFLKSNFVYVHQFCKLVIREEKYEISSRIIYELGDKTLALRNYQVDWMQLLDRQVDVQIESLFRDFNAEQVKNLEKNYFCGGSMFSARELLETSDGVLLKECLENADKTLQDYLCYCIKSKICGQLVTVKVCQPNLAITTDVTELQCYIRWITANQFKITSSSVEHEGYYLVEGRYELLYRLEYNQKNKSLDEDLKSKKKKEISSPLLNNSDSTTIWVARDFSKRKSIIVKIGERTHEEYFLLSKVNHPNIIQFNNFYPATESMSNSFIVYPNMGSDLYKMAKIDNIQLSTSNIRKICEQLVSAVACLHKNNFSHRDIKLENLFFNLEEEHLWLADFDGSSDFTGSKKVSINGYTPKLNEPPEIALEAKMSNMCDAWGIGVVLYQLLSYDFTTSLVDDFKNGGNVMQLKLEALEDQSGKEDLIQIVLNCIQYEEDRISVEELEILQNNIEYDSIETQDFKSSSKELFVKNGMLLKEFEYEEFQDDPEMVEIAVKSNYMSLQYASDSLRNNHIFILDMVKKYPNCIRVVEKSLLNDSEFVFKLFQLLSENKNLEYEFIFTITTRQIYTELINEKTLKLNREIVLTIVKQNGNALKYASDELKSDREIVLEAVKQNGNAFEYASDKLKLDRELILETGKRNGYAFKYATDELKLDREFMLSLGKIMGNSCFAHNLDTLRLYREFMLDIVKQNGNALEYASDELKSDRTIVLEAVKENGNALEYASDELKSDREIALEAVKQNGTAVGFVSDKLKSDREIVLEVVKQNGNAFKYATDELKSDREFMLSLGKIMGNSCFVHNLDTLRLYREFILDIVKRNGFALEYASDELKSDREIVLEAVKQHGNAFKYASKELKSDREFMLSLGKIMGNSCFAHSLDTPRLYREFMLDIVKQNGYAFKYMPDELKSDREIALEAVKQNGYALEYASDDLKLDREIVFEAVKQNGYAIKYASDDLKLDREIVFEAVKQNGHALEYASDELKSDKEIVLKAVEHGYILTYVVHELKSDKEIVLKAVSRNGSALKYASNELKLDREIVFEAVKQNGNALEYASDELKSDREIVLEAVSRNGSALKYASNELKSDREIVFESVKENGYALKYASDELKSDREIVLTAVSQNGFALEYASDELKSDREIVLKAVKENGYARNFASQEMVW